MKPVQLSIIFLCFLKLYLVDGFIDGTITSKSTSNCIIGGVTSSEWTAPKGHIVLEFGTPLEIYCSLDLETPTTKGYTAKDIVFRKNAEKIDTKYVTVLNKTTARLYMDDLPISIKNEHFNCTLELHKGIGEISSKANDSPMKDSPEQLICSNNVIIGSKPQEVSNFSCYNYNWASLNCSWNEPNNGIETNYSIYYWIPRKSKKTHSLYQCPIRQKENCAWTTSTDPMFRPFFKHIYFQMDGVNQFGSTNQTFKFDNFKHAIPAAPTEITPVEKTPHSIFLQWNFGMWVIFDMDLDYVVEYARSSTQDWNTKKYYGKDVKKFKDTVRVNVTDFPYPNIPYDFRIYMKSPLTGEDCWSQPASAVIKTSPCAPYVSPETDVGSFEVYKEYSHHRDVLIYWKQIPELEHNGDNLHYNIVVWENNARINIRPDFIGNSYANFTNLSSHSYKFHITSVNEIGSAAYSSVVHLPKKRDILPRPISFTKVDTGNGGYHLSWQLPNSEDSKITNITIFWCETNREFAGMIYCPGLLNWTHLTPGKFELDFPADPNIGLEFAISLNSHKSSSGMKWASCGNFRKRQISRIKYIWPEEVGTSFIKLRWKLECAEKMDGIKGYNINYCLVNVTDREICIEYEKTAVVYGNGTLNHANLTDLQKSSYYKISVVAFTGLSTGPKSVVIWTRTGEDELHDIKNEPIVIINNGAKLAADIRKEEFLSSSDPSKENDVYR